MLTESKADGKFELFSAGIEICQDLIFQNLLEEMTLNEMTFGRKSFFYALEKSHQVTLANLKVK